MAGNKFATMVHRNTNKLTLILVYAILEWILIVLLLLNSFFSYLIIKFADYFGLKPPCLWCSRVDHIFEPEKKKNLHRDLLCEAHATEISNLGFCSNHRKLAESRDMCEDCLSSRPESNNLALFPLVKQIGMIEHQIEEITENVEKGLKCSCCGVSLEGKIYSPLIVIKPSWGLLDCSQKRNLVQIEEGDDRDRRAIDFVTDRCKDGLELEESGENENQMFSEGEGDCSVSVANSGLRELGGDEDGKYAAMSEAEEEPAKEEENSNLNKEEPVDKQDTSTETLSQHLEFFVGHDGYGLIPIELIDSTTEGSQNECRNKVTVERNDDHRAGLDSKIQREEEERDESAESSAQETKEEAKFAVLESMEIEEDENCLVFHAKECDFVREVYEHVEPQARSKDLCDDQDVVVEAGEDERNSISDIPAEEGNQVPTNETEADVSIGTEIPDLEPEDDLLQNQEPPCMTDDPATSSTNLQVDSNHDLTQVEEDSAELKAISVEAREHVMKAQVSLGLDLNEIEEDKVPDTPTSLDSLHKKLLLLEKRESGTEESLDGSVISEFESCEGVLTVERLKSVLKAERKALHALYAELEEERSASAVAASQTMAMINRLQEEKAAMQMEALQYQRMMEEQSEYDQEALQLLNELMVKREKEKQELEKELELYRKKVLEYEAREKMRLLKKTSETCSASSSNSGDSDGLSIDLNQEAKEEDGFEHENGHHNTPLDAVLDLEESLTDFEEERLSILEQLKVLEEKLFCLADEEEQHFEDVKPIEHLYEQNGNHYDENSDFFDGKEGDVVVNGFPKEMNGKHHQEGRIMLAKGKRLLPLLMPLVQKMKMVL
ncbi:hypothetical protein NMG60_11023676 [Bertholletia excelsa]